MAVDEKKLGSDILGAGEAIVPGAFLFIAYFILTGNQWLIAPAALALAAAYHIRNWDGRCMLAWGIASFLLAMLNLGPRLWTADSLAIDGFWLCFAGIARMMGAGLVSGPAAENKGAGKKAASGTIKGQAHKAYKNKDIAGTEAARKTPGIGGAGGRLG